MIVNIVLGFIGILILIWAVGGSAEGFETMSTAAAAPDVTPIRILPTPTTACRVQQTGPGYTWICPNETEADKMIEFILNVDKEGQARGYANAPVSGGPKPDRRRDQVCIQEYSTSSRFFCKNMNLVKGEPDVRGSLFESSGKACDALISGFDELAGSGVQVKSLKDLTTGIKGSIDAALAKVNEKLAKNCGPGKGGVAEVCTGLQSASVSLQQQATTLNRFIQQTIAGPLADAEQANTMLGNAYSALGCQYSAK